MMSHRTGTEKCDSTIPKENPSGESRRIGSRLTPSSAEGVPVFGGMRIRVSDVLDLLANGLCPEDIVEESPDLEPLDIEACLRFAPADGLIFRYRWHDHLVGRTVPHRWRRGSPRLSVSRPTRSATWGYAMLRIRRSSRQPAPLGLWS